jgi:hypothetical protein
METVTNMIADAHAAIAERIRLEAAESGRRQRDKMQYPSDYVAHEAVC